MTLDERLKEMLKEHYNDMYEHWERGGHADPTPATILAIKQAVLDSLPGEKDTNDGNYQARFGWNAYREEVRKGLGST